MPSKMTDAEYRRIEFRGEIYDEELAQYPKLHWCPDWDYMLVNDDMDAFEACTCKFED